MTPNDLYDRVTQLAAIMEQLEQEIPTLEPQLPGMELPDLLRTWRLLDWLKKACEGVQDLAGSHKKPIGELAHQRLVSVGMEGIDFDGCRWKPEVKNAITCPTDKQGDLLVYAKTEDQALGELIKETIHQKALESYVNGLLAEGKEPPPMVKVFPMNTVSCRTLPKPKVAQ